MPVDWKRYPAHWKAISIGIRLRDGNKCKWCGAPNGDVGKHHPEHGWKNAQWWVSATASNYGADAGREELPSWWPRSFTKIVLTVAHLGTTHRDGRPGNKHDKMDVRDENLAALCQKCHLNYDRDEHAENAAKTRERKRSRHSPTLPGLSADCSAP